jgi:hypothetical protein
MHARTALSYGPYAGGSAWFAGRWRDRFHAGVRASGGALGGVRFVQEMAEAGVWLHASRSVDVLLGWRTGHAYLEIDVRDGRPITVHAFAIEPVAELAFRISRRVDVRVAPLHVTGYYVGLWQAAFGPEVGVAWSF